MKPTKILVTGGPVHAYIDSVKIVTNRFKGGLMTSLAGQLATPGNWVILLRNKGNETSPPVSGGIMEMKYHDGFEEYRRETKFEAGYVDAVVLGAAVANLIPANPINGKFPSHNYKVGDVIPIDFTIAPRVIGEVKKKMKPGAHLFGFKLLSGAPHEELVRAAYEVLLESGATAIFANDALDLQTIYAVTKERGVHKMSRSDIAQWIKDSIADQYYETHKLDSKDDSFNGDLLDARRKFVELTDRFGDKYKATPEGYLFGTIAIRRCDKDGRYNGFFTTGRGKRELHGPLVYVGRVEHGSEHGYMGHRVWIDDLQKKATLNAPLLDWLFVTNPNVESIVHYHEIDPTYPILSYATPGTYRDSMRSEKSSFNVSGHGVFLLIDKQGRIL